MRCFVAPRPTIPCAVPARIAALATALAGSAAAETPSTPPRAAANDQTPSAPPGAATDDQTPSAPPGAATDDQTPNASAEAPDAAEAAPPASTATAPAPRPEQGAPEPPGAKPAKTRAAPIITQVQVAVPTTAIVHIAVDYDDAWLEMRSVTDRDDWRRACPAPCDRELTVDGQEARVAAPGMITSNAFRIEPGGGVARLRVAGGSETARTAGLTLMLAGLPVSFGGMTAFGLGATQDEPGVQTAGLVAAITGGVAILASLPLLLSGSTNVRNQDGDYIAGGSPPAF